MIDLPESAVELIESGVHAHVVTINSGRLAADLDGLVCPRGRRDLHACLTPRRKLENARRDPRAVVSYESPQTDHHQGLHYYLVVKGRAR